MYELDKHILIKYQQYSQLIKSNKEMHIHSYQQEAMNHQKALPPSNKFLFCIFLAFKVISLSSIVMGYPWGVIVHPSSHFRDACYITV